jgi:hypothetical protein
VPRRERCPVCKRVVRRVRLGRRFLTHYHCKYDKWVGIVAAEGTRGINAVELVKAHGVGPDGHLLKHHQTAMFPEVEK